MTNEGNSIYQCDFDTVETIPGIYCFSALFENLRMNAKFLKESMLKNNLFNKNKVFEKYYLKEIFVAIPDDVQPMEKRFLEEFLFTSINSRLNVKFTFENLLVTTEDKEYICLYKTCRMFVVSYISNKKEKAKLSLERKDYTEAELKDFIDNIHYDVKGKLIKVYLVGEDMEKYLSIGELVDYDKILRNFVEMN
jgi:hypothetical protein